MVALLVFLIVQSEELEFAPDYAFFDRNNGLTYIEVYYRIPHRELIYAGDDELTAAIRFSFCSENLTTGDSLEDSWEKKSVIPSLEEARNRDLEIIELTAFSLAPGDYQFRYKVTDLGSAREGIIIDTVQVPGFEDDELILSWIELASEIKGDSVPGQFFKNNLRVIPNPGGYYSVTRPILYSYTEIYNLSSDTLPFEVEYKILDENGVLVRKYPPKQLAKAGTDVMDVGALNVIGLPTGNYRFSISVTDLGTGMQSSREKAFSVVPFRKPPPPELEEYYGMIEYLIPSRDLTLYNSLSEKAKTEYLYQLWRKLDPNPETEENEALPEFAEKIRFADENFSTSRVKGRDTDRGRIHIKYGEADEIGRSGTELLHKSWESWVYYGRGGIQFIFVDTQGSGVPELIYSSIPEEPTRTGWQRYVDPSIVEFKQ